MSPQIQAALIAGAVSLISLAGTVVVALRGYRATMQATKLTADQAHRDTADALAAQREQLDRTLGEQRARTLNERFATVAAQLGDKNAAVRLAGIHALAGLADDWPESRQTCVDILCAYLRLPAEPEPASDGTADHLDFAASREVRRTAIGAVLQHLRPDATTSWQGLRFDFTGATFDDGDFGGARFSGGSVDFSYAKFSGGKVDFSGAKFSGGRVSFVGAKFSGAVISFNGAEFSGAMVSFGDAVFSGGKVGFSRVAFSGGMIDFNRAEFSGATIDFSHAGFSGAEVRFGGSRFSAGEVGFDDSRFSGGRVYLGGAAFSGCKVTYARVEFSGGEVYFGDAWFSSGEVSFEDARFSGCEIRFKGAHFGGADVDFSSAADWSHPPTFTWTGVRPARVRLPTDKPAP